MVICIQKQENNTKGVYEMQTKKDVKYPCVNCKYFKACGNTNRTEPCNGREVVGRTRKLVSWHRKEQ